MCMPIDINTLRPRHIYNGRHFPGDIFKCIFLNGIIWIFIMISLKFVPKGTINNNPALVQIMAWRRLGDKPLSEPMMISVLTHLCVTRPEWVTVSFQAQTLGPSSTLSIWLWDYELRHTWGNILDRIQIVQPTDIAFDSKIYTRKTWVKPAPWAFK